MSDVTQAIPSGEPEQVVVADRYGLIAMLGRGGTAEVWRAEDRALGRQVALKLVTVPTDDSAARAGEEARLLAKLNHPGLVPVYDAGSDDRGRPWVVMELVEGETLADTLRRGPVPSRRAAVIGRSVALALGYVHSQGLVHRDVKPANVLVGLDERVRLTDFGIARLVDSARVTSTGMMVGTASYLAPEQVTGESVGPPADVYALGLLLLECLTGAREYAGSTVEVALARLHRQPVIPQSLEAGWPGLLAAMTARDPAARPRPPAVADELAAIASGGEATTVLAAAAAPAPDRTQVFARTAAVPEPRYDPPAAAPRPAAVPVRRGPSPWVYALLLLALGVAVIGGLLYADARGGITPGQLEEVDRDLPDELERDLQRLRDAVDG
jgi:serine/threonine protein kinase